MPVYKDEERGTWYCSFYYVDYTGKRRLKKKRGFKRQKDAKDFEAEFKVKAAGACDMTFGSLYEIYCADMENRLKENTMETKHSIFESKLLPAFKNRKINEITPAQIRQWQSKIIKETGSETYQKTINNQLSAIFNYAVKYYHLPSNPVKQAGNIGRNDAPEMKFWTVEQFQTFIPNVKKMPGRIGLEILFWTGLRIGELLALTQNDIDLDKQMLHVRRSFQTIKGREVITDPKTEKSKRDLPLPPKLCDEIRSYIDALYEPDPDDRLFPYTKHYFRKQMQAGCAAAGMEPIRLHDLRHSHAALLINLKYPILLVSQRLGHDNIETTLRTYGHLYPSTTSDMVEKLDSLMP